MPLGPNDDIHALRDEINDKLERTNDLIRDPAATLPQVKALRAMARELTDFETMLADAVFLKNTSAIAKLTGEIEEATQAGLTALQFLKDVRDAVVTVRATVKKATGFAKKVKGLTDEIDELARSLVPGGK